MLYNIMYLDPIIVAHFKAKAGDHGCQTLITDALWASITQQGLEECCGA